MQEEAVTPAYLREQAEKCLRLARGINDAEAIAALRNMAMEYWIRANRLDDAEHNGVRHPSMDLPPEPS